MSEDGSEGSPPRPVRRKIKKVMVLSSASESDSDESVAVGSTRRKRMRVLSDDGASSSGSSVVRGRRRALPALRDSDADSDSSGWASDAPPTAATAAQPASGFASDSSEGNSDKCSICLLRFKDQEVGTPQTCEHIFCLDCITEWSKNVNTCPVDRITFNSIVVRACAGGRVLRTEPVKVVERRPSVDILVVEDPTPCEICGSSDNEETMLLCDGCDLGYHMQCLTPALTEVPVDQWLCPNCDDLMEVIHLSELTDLFDEMADLDLPQGPRSVPLRMPRNVRRSARNSVSDEPSTSSGIRASSSTTVAPSTSRTNRSSRSSRTSSSRTTTRRRTTGTHRRKYRRRTKTVLIEYEVEENGKFPVTKTIKRRLKKRKTRKRQPRTAARRSYVRASVRAKLAGMRDSRAEAAATLASVGAGGSELSVHRHRAGIPALSLFGSAHDLDYFSEEEHDVTEGAAAAVSVAVRPNHSVLSTYRQARRKMISIPSPPHAASAPDILSSIMESQTLLHSKRAVVSVTGTDGKLDIKLDKRDPRPKDVPIAGPTPAPASTEPQRVDVRSGGGGSARQAPAYGGGRAAGGWGGGYRGGRVPPASPAAPPPHMDPPPRPAPYGPRRGPDPPPDYAPHYAPDMPPYLRGRRPPENGRPPPFRRQEQPPGRHSAGPGWPPYGPPAPQRPPPPQRHSYGGGPPEDPLDMRTASAGPPPATFGPLPEPPTFKFDRTPEPERSEDEENSGLVIDTEKYDPTEPTNDDESGDETPECPPAPPAAVGGGPPAPSPPPADAVRTALAGLDAAAINVPANVLDSAVRQVLAEHRDLMAAPRDPSDDDSDGDCPNFSIYSATSVHIASNTGLAVSAAASAPVSTVTSALRTVEDQYKEKVSKRCPITTNTRNPIKIKLNTPSLIKRQVSLYDEEEEDAGGEPEDEEPAPPTTDQGKDPPGDASGKDDESAEVTPVTADDEQQYKDESGDNEEVAIPETKDDSPKNDIEKEEDVLDDVPATQEEEEEEEHPGTPETPDIPDTPEPAPSLTEQTEEDVADEEEPHDDTAEDAAPVEPGDRPDRSPDEVLEKMTESISETEDERSYTPCLDENKSKDTSLETDKEKGIEGLDTEMISEEEGNDMFSEEEARAPSAGGSPARPDDDRKRRRRDARKEGKDKKTKGKKGDVAFKKLSKSGKERNYRDKDKERGKRERRDSADAAERKQKRKEKRKDLERYDVRTVVTEKRKRVKDAFGRDVSPPSPSGSSPPRRRRSGSTRRKSISPRRKSISPRRKSISPRRKSISPRRKSITPRRKSISPRRRSITPRRRSITPRRRSITPRRRSITPRRRSITPRRRSISPRRRSVTPRRKSISPRRKSISPKRKSPSPRRRSLSRARKPSPARRRRSGSRARKRRRSASHSPKPKTKKKKRMRSERPPSRRRSARRNKSPKRKRAKRSRTPTPGSARAPLAAEAGGWSPSVASCLLSPRTPPAPRRHRRDPLRTKPGGPCKEVFTSGDNILVSVSFKDQERDRDVGEKRKRREAKRDKRRKRRRAAAAAADVETAKPIAIIDLERSPFREITPSPKNVIVLSDSDQGDKENDRAHVAPPAPEPEHHVGPKTPPEPEAAPGPGPLRDAERPEAEARGPSTPPDSPDAYDPFEPTASPEPAAAPAEQPAASPPHITLEAAQKTNLSADDVIDRRPISPIEKVMALLQSTRDVSPEPPPGDASLPPSEPAAPGPGAGPGPGPGPAALAVAPSPAPPRIVLPSPTRSQPPKLFLAKPSPIKSNPVKPMQATKISRLPLPMPRRDEVDHDSPYSPGSSDFGDLFEPPGGGGGTNGKGNKRDNFDSLFDKPSKGRKNKSSAAKVPVKLNKKKGNKTQVGVKIDEDNLKILDDLPSSAVEMQVKSKVSGNFLKKLNRQERVVEEVKMVLKPHYNKKHVTKDEYKDILRRCVPKICHNKSGEINPTKIQALVEAYVKKFRKKHKLGLA